MLLIIALHWMLTFQFTDHVVWMLSQPNEAGELSITVSL